MRKPGGIWMILGLLLLAAALGLTVFNMRQANEAGQEAKTVVAQLEAPVETQGSAAVEETLTQETGPEIPDYLRNPQKEMPTQNIKGYDYIGVLSIPALGLELPVMSTWDYTRLRVAPCRYTGSVYQDNMTICAHNYASHFGTLRKLQVGDSVTFTDVEENVFSYAVTALETLALTAVEEMTQGDWDLTLFTCTVGGSTRVTVRCDRVIA